MLGKFLAITLFLAGAAGVCLAQNYKIKQVTTMSGQKMESAVYVRGSRKRTEMGGIMGIGGDVADVQQCDLKRSLKINDKKKMYAVEPFDDGTDAATTPAPNVKSPKAKVEKGGTVTLTNNISDTGERKQMFGLTARHIKMTMTMQASPGACMEGDMKMEIDGWYVDLPEFSCPMSSRPEVPSMGGNSSGGCRDKMVLKTSGGGKLGFALSETRTMNMSGTSFSQTLETVEFSKATLDAALFDIPAGYKQTDDTQTLYGKPDMSRMMKNMGDDDDEDTPKTSSKNNSSMNNSPAKSKKAGMIRIGVYAPTNKAGEDVSTTNLQSFLIQKLTSGSVEAVSVSSDADAQAAECDFVLTSDFSKLKQSTSSKIGGMFGKVTNTDSSSTKNFDAQIDFKLVALATGKAVAQSKANAKGTDVDRTAEDALSKEAETVLNAAKK